MENELDKTFQINLREANHLISYKVPLPSKDQVKNPYTRLYRANTLEDLAKYVNQYVQSGQKIALLLPDDGSGDEAIKVADDQYEAHVIGERTLLKTADRIGANLIQNISKYSHLPWVTDLSRPLKGIPAFIVYSGHSLDKNIHLLEECKKHGVVFSTGTPVKALLKFGVQPDILVNIESRELHDSMEGVKPLVQTCDMTCHEHNWKVDSKYSLRMYQPDLAYLKYCLECGTMPIPNGGFVGSTAINLAYLWGADPIVLLGFDLALTDDKPCTQHIGSDSKVRYDGNMLIMESSHPAKGKSFWTEVEAYGGDGVVRTTYERVGYRKYLERFADLVDGIEIINATEGGARISGWAEKSLEETLKTATWHAKVHNHRATLKEQLAALESQNGQAIGEKILNRIQRNCEKIVELGGKQCIDSDMEVRRLSREEPIIFTLLAPRFIRLKYEKPDEQTRLKRVREITIECAITMLRILEGV